MHLWYSHRIPGLNRVDRSRREPVRHRAHISQKKNRADPGSFLLRKQVSSHFGRYINMILIAELGNFRPNEVYFTETLIRRDFLPFDRIYPARLPRLDL